MSKLATLQAEHQRLRLELAEVSGRTYGEADDTALVQAIGDAEVELRLAEGPAKKALEADLRKLRQDLSDLSDCNVEAAALAAADRERCDDLRAEIASVERLIQREQDRLLERQTEVLSEHRQTAEAAYRKAVGAVAQALAQLRAVRTLESGGSAVWGEDVQLPMVDGFVPDRFVTTLSGSLVPDRKVFAVPEIEALRAELEAAT